MLGCRIADSLQGVFYTQPENSTITVLSNGIMEPIVYDKVVISGSSTSSWGDCYETFDNSYLFEMKHIGGGLCFRCLTLVLRSDNVLQAAHQNGNPCKDSLEEARKSCFDSDAISPTEGTFLFRAENRQILSCGLDGPFQFSFNKDPTNLKCENFESTMSNCQMLSKMNFAFHNCTFPDFEMNLSCLGTWKGRANETYIAVENEESKQLQCGVILHDPSGEVVIQLASDSVCNGLSPLGASAAETYRFRPRKGRPEFTACRFPEWLQGMYDDMVIAGEQLVHSPHAPLAVATISHCIAVDGQRVAVFSESQCGEAVGFHCLWFRSRSDSVIEFKTTNREDVYNSNLCSNEEAFQFSQWTAMVAEKAEAVPCGYSGTFSTPKALRDVDCYSMVVDCSKRHLLKVSAFHCTTGVTYETRHYHCLGSWKEQDNLFLYTARASQSTNVCFITREHKGLLYVSSSGAHCQRDFNFTLNGNKTIVLQKESECNRKGVKKLKEAAIIVETSSAIARPSSPSTILSEPPVVVVTESTAVSSVTRSKENRFASWMLESRRASSAPHFHSLALCHLFIAALLICNSHSLYQMLFQ